MPAPRSRPVRRMLQPLTEFLQTEFAGGVVLLVATVAALGWANSPVSASYDSLWHTSLTLDLGPIHIAEDLRHWIGDALMAVFFYVVGLEIKRELVDGELRDPRAAVLPVVAAVGGMAVPALLFLAFNAGTANADGWAIPMATDIAFAIGVLTVLGSRVPASLKLYLLTLAIVDDIGAIAVIAIFYTSDLDVVALASCIAALAVFALLQGRRVRTPLVYVPVAAVAWYALLESGIHATLAGVALGLLTRAKQDADEDVSPVERIEHRLHPLSSLLIVPVFALANAGVDVSAAAVADAVTGRVGLGVIVGLVAGKTIGVAGASWLAVRLGIGRLPSGVDWPSITGVALVAGIGFTVSLFVTGLAFGESATAEEAKLGVLLASVLAAIVGAAVLAVRGRHHEDVQPTVTRPPST